MAYITGTNSAETLPGTSSADLIYAFDGNDVVSGGTGDDYINGGRGNDQLNGELGNDIFEVGGSGSDSGVSPAGGLTNGWDTFNGGGDYDTIRILPTSGYAWTAIQIQSMSGIEALENTSSGPGYVYFTGNISFDTVISMYNIAAIFGSSGADTFQGGDLNETVEGNGGSDTLYGNFGDDTLYGDSSVNPYPSGSDGSDTLYGVKATTHSMAVAERMCWTAGRARTR
jgi:Ca2+-binding RTX toxin-like protein